MPTAVPALDLVRINQAQIGFVDQGGGLERLARVLRGYPGRCLLTEAQPVRSL
jgi:hypothetical protein